MDPGDDEEERLRAVALQNAQSIHAARGRAEEELRKQTEWLRVTLSSIGDAVISTDAEGRLTFMNGVAERLTGWPQAEAIGRPLPSVFRVVNEFTRQPVENPALRALREGTIVGLANHTILIAQDGSERPIADSAAPMRDQHGTTVGAVLVFRDVTEQRRAEEAQERLAAIVESSDDAIISKSLDGVIRTWNAGAERIFGYTAEEAVGQAITLIIPKERRAEEGTILARLRDGQRIDHFETVRVTKDGRRIDISLTVSPLRDAEGHVIGASKVGRDISERKRAEAEMSRVREEERAADKRAERILESVTDAFFGVDREWRFTYLNPQAEVQLQRVKDELIGKVLWEEFPLATGTKFDHEYRTAAETQRAVTFEEYYPAPLDGWYEVHAYPSDEGLAVYFRNITDSKRVEEELRAKDERLNLFVENIKDYAVIIEDPDGTIIEWQGGAERITGYPPEEAIGHKCHLIFTPEDQAAGIPEHEMKKAAETGRADDKRWHRKKDGSLFFADGVVTALTDGRGKLRGFGKVFKDATGEWQAEQATIRRAAQLQRLADISARINAAHDVHSVVGVVTEEARSLIGARQAATRMVLNPQDPRPINVVSTVVDRSPERPSTIPNSTRLYEPVKEENQPIRLAQAELAGDPRWRALERVALAIPALNGWLAAPLVGRDGKSLGLLQLADKYDGEFTAEDEALLVQLSRLAAIAIENAKLYEELRGNDQRKDEFLAMLAHELRNPLSAIGNAVSLTTMTGNQEYVAWSMEVIARQMKHLMRLIDDLLDVSRISRGKIELRKDVLDATPILDSALATVKPLADERKHTLEVSIDRGNLWVSADPTRLEQVVVNLLNNAAKYSEDAGRIHLYAHTEGESVIIRVRDWGVGIPIEKLPGMFELFAQGDRTLARSEGGLGIGLTVVKKLVELHGGSVTAISEGLGKGSEFTIRLPAATRPTVEAARTATKLETTSKVSRILVVDDNMDMTRGMARLLKYIGHEVATAHDGHEALKVARQFKPEFILLDIGLPGMDGYEVASKLRQEVCCKDAVIVAISGYGQEEDRRRSKEAGFDHHLIKPLDHDALLRLLFGAGNDRG